MSGQLSVHLGLSGLPGRVFAGALILALSTGTAMADADVPAQPTHLKCVFTEGTSGSYDSGHFSSKPASPLTFEIAAIDLDAQSANLVLDNTHQGQLKIVRALNANSFLEVASEGFLNLTTVYDLDPATGTYPAVHSRHFGLLGQPVFAQYSGTCTAE